MANDFTKMAKRVESLADDIENNVESEVEDGMEDTASQARRNVRQKDSVASGRLIANLVTVERPSVGNTVTTVSVTAPDVYRYLEYGTGIYGPYKAPNPQPPIEPILTWMMEKGVTPDADGPYDTMYGLAEAIATTIGDVGNRSHPFMRPAWYSPRGRVHVIRNAERGMNRAVRRATRSL